MPISNGPLATVTRTYAPSCVSRKLRFTHRRFGSHTYVPVSRVTGRFGCKPKSEAFATNARGKTNTCATFEKQFSAKKVCARHVVWQSQASDDVGSGDDCDESVERESKVSNTTNNSFTTIAKAVTSVGVFTLLCKLLGLFREMVIAASFGVGQVVDAYAHASTIPTFFFIAIGGLNGPLHSLLSGVLTSVKREDGDKTKNYSSGSDSSQTSDDSISIAQAASCVVTVVCAVTAALSVFTFVFSDLVVRLTSPGLQNTLYVTVAEQLRIMSPCILLAAVNGIAMAKSTVAGKITIPVLSPGIGSICVLLSIVAVTGGGSSLRPEIALAVGTTIGAIAQCVVLNMSTAVGGTNAFANVKVSLPSLHAVHSERAKRVIKNLARASLTSGVMQIAATCDLFFASFIPAAAAGLGYSTLLAMTPLGILSTSLITPLVPLFSENKDSENHHVLRTQVSNAIAVTFSLTVFTAAITVPLANPLIAFFFQRNAFDAHATALVSEMFAITICGGFFFVAREIFVRVFFVIGDASVPFRVALVGVVTNAALNYVFTSSYIFNLGAQGITLSTVLTAVVSSVLLGKGLRDTLAGKGEGKEKQHSVLPFHFVKSGVAGVISFIATSVCFTAVSKQAVASALEAAVRLGAAAFMGCVLFIGTAVALKLENPMKNMERFERLRGRRRKY